MIHKLQISERIPALALFCLVLLLPLYAGAELRIESDSIDCGDVFIDSTGYAGYFTLINDAPDSVVITSISFLSTSDVFQVALTVPQSIVPYDRLYVSIAFSPHAVDTEYVFGFDFVVNGQEFQLKFRGRGVIYVPPPPPAAVITIPDISTKVGERYVLPFILTDMHMSDSERASVVNFRGLFQVNASLTTPLNPKSRGTFTSGSQYIFFDGNFKNQNIGDTLFSIPMIAALGDAESTPITLLDWQWRDNKGVNLSLIDSLESGSLSLTDVWHDPLTGWTRLLNADSGPLAMEITDNPLITSTTLTFLTVNSPNAGDFSFRIYTSNGQLLADLSNRVKGGKVIILQRTDFPSAGLYFLRIASGSNILTRTLNVL